MLFRQSIARAQTWLVLCIIAATVSGCMAKTSVNATTDFTLQQVRGGSFHLRAHIGHPILLAFLQTLPDTVDTPSRSEFVSVMSMATQYAPRGLTVAVIDASELAGIHASHDALLNASYDWNVNVPLMEDQDRAVAQRFAVVAPPTIVIVGARGQILQRWTGLVPPAELARTVMLALSNNRGDSNTSRLTSGFGPENRSAVSGYGSRHRWMAQKSPVKRGFSW